MIPLLEVEGSPPSVIALPQWRSQRPLRVFLQPALDFADRNQSELAPPHDLGAPAARARSKELIDTPRARAASARVMARRCAGV